MRTRDIRFTLNINIRPQTKKQLGKCRLCSDHARPQVPQFFSLPPQQKHRPWSSILCSRAPALTNSLGVKWACSGQFWIDFNLASLLHMAGFLGYVVSDLSTACPVLKRESARVSDGLSKTKWFPFASSCYCWCWNRTTTWKISKSF